MRRPTAKDDQTLAARVFSRWTGEAISLEIVHGMADQKAASTVQYKNALNTVDRSGNKRDRRHVASATTDSGDCRA